jgi:amidophosphoribosyltransferase
MVLDRKYKTWSRESGRAVLTMRNLFKMFLNIENEEMSSHPEYADNVSLQKGNIPYIGEFLGHVRYGTLERTVLRCSSFLRQNN